MIDEMMQEFYEKYVKGKPISKTEPLKIIDEIDTDAIGHFIVVHHRDDGDNDTRLLSMWAKEFDVPFDV